MATNLDTGTLTERGASEAAEPPSAPIRDWHRYRVIPARAKTLVLSMMAAGLATLIHIGDGSWVLPGSAALCLMPVAWFIVTRPSRPSRPTTG